jgi:D-tyrosyl-tRNA(Tyr) deacylase
MKAVVQRVRRGSVRVAGETVGAIGPGAVVLLGVLEKDRGEDADRLAERTARLRIFADAEGRMNRSLLDVGGEALVVSQFTLAGDTRKGHRPSFVTAAPPERAESLYERYAARLEAIGVTVARGRFRAMMEVEIVGDGPVTILLEEPRSGISGGSEDLGSGGTPQAGGAS